MSEALKQLHSEICAHLEEIVLLFKSRPKITLMIRNPELDDGDVLISDDDADLAIEAIRRLEHRIPVVERNTE